MCFSFDYSTAFYYKVQFSPSSNVYKKKFLRKSRRYIFREKLLEILKSFIMLIIMRVGILLNKTFAANALAGLDFAVNPTPIHILCFQSVSRIFAKRFSITQNNGTPASFHELFFANAAGSFSSRSTSHGKSMDHITQRVAEKLPDIIFAKNREPTRAL